MCSYLDCFNTNQLRPVHTKHDNYNDKDIVLKIVLIIKEQQSPHHSYNDKDWETILLEPFAELFFPADEWYKHWRPIKIHPAITSWRF